MLTTGTQAPEFSVKDHLGNTVNLKDFRGGKVILWFYPKADTPGCTLEGQGFRDEFQNFRSKKVEIFGVSLDTVAENKAFADKYGFPYRLLCDVERRIALAYHAVKNPEDRHAARISYVIDENGLISEAIAQVDTRTHAKDLCSRL